MGPVETQITFTTSLPITRNTLSGFQIQANNSAQRPQQNHTKKEEKIRTFNRD